ncbi:Tyrosine-protein phosphatase non-receptor type 1 [Cichlidogyrus casuarinus]|uniref:protein-tyrosine-phosphatase n=1 Tax=Cichlidogyrus casuarinus TaxID=1844966 RepID=A0ABD2Q9Y3_9PLAT
MSELENSELFTLFKKYELEELWAQAYQEVNQRTCCSNLQQNTHKAALTIENRSKNRYNNIIPLQNDQTLVPVKAEKGVVYINASFVYIESYSQKRYILSQGPLQSTIRDFWNMVWQHKCPLVLMLNKFIEKCVIKCANYLPRSGTTLDFPDFTVTSSDEIIFSTYIERTIEINPKNSEEPAHLVKHINYDVWPDFGVPEAIDNFLLLLHKLRSSGYLSDPKHPAVIHCSAGVGRSGAFSLIDLVVEMIFSKMSLEGIDLADLICQLRCCRMGLIQTPDQFRFCFIAIIRAAKLILDHGLTWYEYLDDDAPERDTSNFNIDIDAQFWSNSSSSCSEDSQFSNYSSDLDDQDAALKLLKNKKRIEKLLDTVNANIIDIETNIAAIEQAQLNVDIINALDSGNKALKEINKFMTLEKVETVIADLEANAELQKEISELIGPMGLDDDQLNDELSKLNQDENFQLPDVPTHVVEPIKKRTSIYIRLL